MGRYINKGNRSFQNSLNSEIYVDKTELLKYTNRVIDTNSKFICNSRPRRFGKTVTAEMLEAYYSKGCDSESMFSGLKISKDENFKKYLNQYDVIHFDVQWFIKPGCNVEHIVDDIQEEIVKDLKREYPGVLKEEVDLPEAMLSIYEETGNGFIVIIDECDVLIRDEAKNQKVQEEYINFLRRMFKGSQVTDFIHLVYLTGILPIKKVKTQSALNNFQEFTMLAPGQFAPYIGFTEEEVRELCQKYGQDFDEVRRWYDGYMLGKYHVYNPNAVTKLMVRGEFQSYWSQTGTYDSIQPLIDRDFDGLKNAILMMLSGERVKVNAISFKNDMISFRNKDDVLTVLIHMGYLAYDREKKTAFIPNEEIREQFLMAVDESHWNELDEFERQSRDLLYATLEMDEEAVAEGIEKIHMEYASTIKYNDENSLSSVLTIAYLSSMEYYFKPIRELPTGRGFADFVFLPKKEYVKDYPALLVELKWNQNAKTAIEQIREKKYPESLLQYTGDILLVGINYDKKTKVHECVIEQL